MTKLEYAELCLFLIALIKALAKKQPEFKVTVLSKGEYTLSVEKTIQVIASAGSSCTVQYFIDKINGDSNAH